MQQTDPAIRIEVTYEHEGTIKFLPASVEFGWYEATQSAEDKVSHLLKMGATIRDITMKRSDCA